MKASRTPAACALAAASVLALFGPSGASGEDIDCRPVVEQLRQNIEKAPSHVLTLLEDALIANGGHCVPQFVHAAIEASGADAATVKKIVFVAITNAQRQAPEIAEAAVAASPKHADSVRSAFAEAFQDNNPRLKPADPSQLPAWERENAPVPPPSPAPAVRTAPVADTPPPAPRPSAPPSRPAAPSIAPPPIPSAPSGGSGERWELLHDGGSTARQPAAGDPASASGSQARPQAVEPELPQTRKKLFGLTLPKLPDLASRDAAPVDEPLDWFFHPPFGGVPPLKP